MQGHIIANGNHRGDREKTDFYPTPPEATRALLNFLNLPNNTHIWEPACGTGSMSRVLKEKYKVTSTTLYNQGYGEAGIDFLQTKRSCDWIITNPPFKLSVNFIQHAMDCDIIGFAFLLKSQYWHAQKRASLFFKTRPRYILPLTWRPDFGGGGLSTMDVLWTVWVKGYLGNSEYLLLKSHNQPLESNE